MDEDSMDEDSMHEDSMYSKADTKQGKLSAVVSATFMSALSADNIDDFNIAYSRFWRDLYAFKDVCNQEQDEDDEGFNHFNHFKTECKRLKQQRFWGCFHTRWR